MDGSKTAECKYGCDQTWGYSGKPFGVNLLGVVAIFSWSAGWSVLIFGGLKWVGMLRIDRDTEFRGNDTVKHGEAAYPVDAWVSKSTVVHDFYGKYRRRENFR